MQPALFNWTSRKSSLFLAVFLFLTLIIYYLLHGRYVLYNGDDAWTMTRLYHYSKTGINMDTIFRAVTTDERVQIFNQLFNVIYTGYLQVFGWTKSNAHILCTAFMFGATLVWYHIIKALKFSNTLAVIFALTMLLFPAYFGTANLIRTDPMTFFLSAVCFLLFIKKRYFWSAFVGLMAVETHPMGIIAAFYILAYVSANWKYFFGKDQEWRKVLLPAVAGVGLGIAYYVALHWHVLSWERFEKTLLDNRNNAKELPSYLITYFAQTEWYLHLWELFLLLGTIIWYIAKRGWRTQPIVWTLLLMMILSTFVTGRPNRVYMVFIFPAFQLMLLYTAEQAGKLKMWTFLLMVLFILHYGNVYRMNHSFNHGAVHKKTEALIPDKSIPVVGMADNWFPAKDHKFHLIYNSINDLVDQPFKAFYLIENEYLHIAPFSIKIEEWALEEKLTGDALILKRKKHYQKTIAYFKANYDCQNIGRFRAYLDGVVQVNYCKTKK